MKCLEKIKLFKFSVEDTFTPWADSKLQTIETLQMDLLNQLGKIFLEETDPYVPVVSGSLQESAHFMWHFVEALPTVGLQIIWTGIFNDNDTEYDYFENYYHGDYALSVYYGEHYKSGSRASSDHWVESGLWSFDSMVNPILQEKFLSWLFGK